MIADPADPDMEIYAIPLSDAPGDDKYIIYRPLLGLAFIGNRAMANLTIGLSSSANEPVNSEIARFLDSVGFFRPDPPAPQPPPLGHFTPLGLTLLLTNQCQLRCIYCYAAAGESARQDLPIVYGQLAIDYVCDVLAHLGYPRLDISLHGGGEPTFTWKILRTLVAYARQKPLPSHIHLTSNGIWSSQQVQWITSYIDRVSISMDGSPQTQNRQRPLVSGRDSSAWIMRTLAELDRRSFPYAIRMTATAPWENLPHDIQFICETTHCSDIWVEPAFNAQRGQEGQPNTAQATAFTAAFLDAFDLASQAGRHLGYSGANPDNITAAFCSSAYSAMIVNPQGSLVACYAVTDDEHELAPLMTFGRIENGTVRIDEDARKYLHELLSERHASCRECYCYWTCGGDCYLHALSPTSSSHLNHGERCEVNRNLTRGLLLRRIAAGGGIWQRALPCNASCVGSEIARSYQV